MFDNHDVDTQLLANWVLDQHLVDLSGSYHMTPFKKKKQQASASANSVEVFANSCCAVKFCILQSYIHRKPISEQSAIILQLTSKFFLLTKADACSV